MVCCENGCGKTTLVRLITGEVEPDKGSIYINSRISISKLEQFEKNKVGYTVEDYVENIFKNITTIEQQIRELEISFATEYSDAVANEYAQLVDFFETLGGYDT